MLRHLNPPGASAPPFYSHAVEVTAPARLLFVSGQVGVTADGRVGADIGEQTAIAVKNLEAVLATAGMDRSRIAKLTIFLTDPGLFDGFTQAAASLLNMPPAAATLLYVKALAAPQLLVEIEAVAAG